MRGHPVNLNKDQREGVAKVADNLATACMVAAIVGGFVDNKIGWPAILTLFVMFVVLVLVGVSLRQTTEGDENGG